MYGPKVITVTPAGRARYMEILHHHLIRHRHIINKHIWWQNTDHGPDIEFMRQLARDFPGFYEVETHEEVTDKPMTALNIHKFFPACCDPDTVYIRFDDDICWMDTDAVERLVEFRMANPEPFLVFGNIVNNGICNHIHREIGAIPPDLPLTWDAVCPFSWGAGWNSLLFHMFFKKHHINGDLDRYKFSSRTLDKYERFSINVISWLGKDFAQFGGAVDREEESWLSCGKPYQLQRPCVICGDALFVHFAYWPQRGYLEYHSDFLAWYAEISTGRLS